MTSGADIAKRIADRLRAVGTEKRAVGEKAYLKRGHIDRVAPGSSVAWARPGDT